MGDPNSIADALDRGLRRVAHHPDDAILFVGGDNTSTVTLGQARTAARLLRQHADTTDARPVEPWHGWLAAAELDEYPTFMDLMEMQERLAPLADYLDALGFDHDAELVRRMLFPTGTVADLRAERDDLAARLSALTDAIGDAVRAIRGDHYEDPSIRTLCVLCGAADGSYPCTALMEADALADAAQPPDSKEAT
jgi:hypothetical protein